MNNTINERLKNVRQYAKQCLEDEAQALLELIPQLDENFDKAVNMIYNCKGKIIVTGVGKSGHIGAKIAATLSSTGTPSFFLNPLDAYHGDLGAVNSNDLVIAISNSGQTDELLRFIPMLLHNEIPIIGMSGNPHSLLAKYSTHQCVCGTRGMSSQFGPHKQHHSRIVDGRCPGCSTDGSAQFQAQRLCTVPPRRRAG